MTLDLSTLAVLFLNALAWAWGASRLMQSVQSLEKTSTKLEEAVEKLSGMLSEHAARLAALEAINSERKPG
jgi:hypothetical protein